MLSRLLKHEFRNLGKIVFPLCAVIVVACLFIGISIRVEYSLLVKYENAGNISFFVHSTVIGFIAISLIAVYGTLICAEIMMFIKYHKSVSTDEAYLTFTLPIKPSIILFAKLLTTYVYTLIITVITIVSIMLAVFLGTFSFELFYDILNSINNMITDFGTLSQTYIPFYLVEMILLVITGEAAFVSAVFLGITWGGILTTKHKNLTVICMVSLVLFVLQMINGIANNIILGSVMNSFNTDRISQNYLILLGFYILMSVGITVGTYFISANMLKTKLNLS